MSKLYVSLKAICLKVWLWLIVCFLRVMTKVKVSQFPENLAVDGTTTCYVFQNKSYSDVMVFAEQYQKLGLPKPAVLRSLSSKLSTNLSGKLIFLRRPEMPDIIRGKLPLRSPEILQEVIEQVQSGVVSNIRLIPVSVYWGRTPDKERSFWKIIFSDTWSAPSVLRKLFMMVFHGRETLLNISAPIWVNELMESNASSQRMQRKLFRVLRVHFRRQREAIIGPDLSHKRLLSNQILTSSQVLRSIQIEMADKNLEVKKLEDKTREYVIEIAADYSYSVIRLYDVFLSWLWNRIYEGIEIYNLQRLKTVAADHAIIYVPCHRSHVDYLLLSYVVFNAGLVPPHIAAGTNLNIPVLGSILRRGGAFFLRRSFKDNALYSAVLHEYVHTVLRKGFSIEYFIEGTRSRSGRLLPPRHGMLSMTLKSYVSYCEKPLMFVPVYIGYEKLFEGKTYIKELLGKKKRPESWRDILRAFMKTKNQFGKVHVNFGTPISLDSILSEYCSDWRQLSHEAVAKATWVKGCVGEIGDLIVSGINQSVIVEAVNLASLVLLATPKLALDEYTMSAQIAWYQDLFEKLPYSSDTVVTKKKSKEVIDYCIGLGLMVRHHHLLGDIIKSNEATALLMTYFRNNVLHTLILPALCACFVLNHVRCSKEDLIEFIVLIYPLLKTELTLKYSEQELESQIFEIMNYFCTVSVIKRNVSTGQWVKPELGSMAFFQLSLLAACAYHSLERYHILFALLQKRLGESITCQQLEREVCLSAQRIALLLEFNAPEFFDKRLISAAIGTLRDLKWVQWSQTSELMLAPEITVLQKQTYQLLGDDVKHLGTGVQ